MNLEFRLNDYNNMTDRETNYRLMRLPTIVCNLKMTNRKTVSFWFLLKPTSIVLAWEEKEEEVPLRN